MSSVRNLSVHYRNFTCYWLHYNLSLPSENSVTDSLLEGIDVRANLILIHRCSSALPTEDVHLLQLWNHNSDDGVCYLYSQESQCELHWLTLPTVHCWLCASWAILLTRPQTLNAGGSWAVPLVTGWSGYQCPRSTSWPEHTNIISNMGALHMQILW
jgi:hypothetical protein